jgi:tRNA threonylcarbamoyl adenosine modification protein YeaZ/tRNA threonylcarbamoyl adenosine modification protein YjeE
VETEDAAATRALAAALAAAARSGDTISLVGELGAGKTQFAKGFGAGLGVTDTIVSPSFVLMAEYAGRLPLFHIDLYRLADAAEAMAGGLLDERQGAGVTIIEWAERFGDARLRSLPGRRARWAGPMTGGPILAIDTSGTRALVALGSPEGVLIDERRWQAGYRHGEELLTRTDELLAATGVALAKLAGIVVGTGPGAFTGMRVGLATAKALARGLEIPIAGVATSEALLAAIGLDAGSQAVLLLPAGPSDRVVVFAGQATLVKGGEEPVIQAGAVLVAVDLPDRAPAEALALGANAEEGLSAALLRLGAIRIAAGGDDVARLVPEYVTLPRGIATVKGEVRWSRDRT